MMKFSLSVLSFVRSPYKNVKEERGGGDHSSELERVAESGIIDCKRDQSVFFSLH